MLITDCSEEFGHLVIRQTVEIKLVIYLKLCKRTMMEDESTTCGATGVPQEKRL